MSKQTIYNALVGAGMTHTGAVAMLCNMYAESGLKAAIAQRGMTKLTDEEYTAAADAGTVDFVHDAVGYGLCQWTYWTRKQGLKTYALLRGKSVGDEALQVAFCIDELKSDYPALWDYLCRTDDLYTAVSRICKEYERPAVNNIDARYSYRTMFEGLGANDEKVYSGLTTDEDEPVTSPPRKYPADMAVLCKGFYGSQVVMLQSALRDRGYLNSVTGVFDDATDKAVKAFQRDNGLTADGIAGAKTFACFEE